jgi:hypothetical protein
MILSMQERKSVNRLLYFWQESSLITGGNEILIDGGLLVVREKSIKERNIFI